MFENLQILKSSGNLQLLTGINCPSLHTHYCTGSLLGPDSLRFFLTLTMFFSDCGIGFVVTDNGFV